MAAGISGCALTEMNDGKIEMLRGGERERETPLEEILNGRDGARDTGEWSGVTAQRLTVENEEAKMI